MRIDLHFRKLGADCIEALPFDQNLKQSRDGPLLPATTARRESAQTQEEKRERRGLGNDERCFGYMTLCGQFDDITSISTNTNKSDNNLNINQKGFGPEGKYQYQLSL